MRGPNASKNRNAGNSRLRLRRLAPNARARNWLAGRLIFVVNPNSKMKVSPVDMVIRAIRSSSVIWNLTEFNCKKIRYNKNRGRISFSNYSK